MANEPATSDAAIDAVKPRTSRARWIARGVLLLAVLAVAALAWSPEGRAQLKAIAAYVEALPTGWFIVALTLLPVFGFPVSVLYLITGAKFGILHGLLILVGVTAVQLMLSYVIARSLRKPLARLMAVLGWKLPEVPKGGTVGLTVLTQLLPGLPFTAKNYLLPIGGVPFAVYFWVSLPIDLFHASLALSAGGLSRGFTPGKAVFIGVYVIIVLWLSHWVFGRLRASTRATPNPQPVESDPKPRA